MRTKCSVIGSPYGLQIQKVKLQNINMQDSNKLHVCAHTELFCVGLIKNIFGKNVVSEEVNQTLIT